MKVKRGLILAAGFGTRMGEIGKVLPKVLWPVFSKSLLELQVLYLKELGVEEIYINLHHQKNIILDFCSKIETFNDVEFLIEEEILGVGGAVHNLATRVNYRDNLLLINADQFCFFDNQYWVNAFDNCNKYSSSLFATRVHKKHRYNETVISKEGNLEKILPIGKQTGEIHLTYGGFGFINLEKIEPAKGKCDFFSDVANYKENEIPMTILPLDFEYWDFGTKERYFYQMQKLKTPPQKSGFISFLKRNGVSVDHSFYYQAEGNSGLILDKNSRTMNPGHDFIAYKDIIEKIDIDESLL